MMFNQKRLHPAAIFFNFIRVLRESLFAVVLGFITFKDDSLFYFILITSGIFILMLTFSILSWYRYTYRIEDEELRIEYGIFIRKKRYISKNRIQSIDLTSGVIHRIFKLTKVQIETAGSSNGAEASLKAVKRTEGDALRQELKTAVTRHEDVHDDLVERKNPSLRISFKRLFLAGSTSGSIGVIFALMAFGFSELEQFIPDHYYDNTVEWAIGLSVIFIVVLVIILLVFLWLLGIAGTMIKYGNFTITKNDSELFITRGLLEKKQVTIPLKRVQAVGIQESIIRQPLGYVTVFAEVAGGSMDKGEDFSSVLFPIMKADEVGEFFNTFLPEYAGETQELIPLPKRARKFYLLRSSLPVIIIGAGVGYFFTQFVWVPILLLIGSFYLGFLRHKDGGFYQDGQRLTIRYRTLSKNTLVMYHKRLQAFEKKQYLVQAKQKLATMRLSIIGKMGMGKHFIIKEMDESHTDQLADWYSYRK
ncbi:PH domain-containing protein [Virgibacillus sp. JSM 102003]|uniref:PH domain-containing protein n=1 Tax=Virgibacillus sp. JSM 102003 TaxID=1562108 RepID=UPI0035C0C42B